VFIGLSSFFNGLSADYPATVMPNEQNPLNQLKKNVDMSEKGSMDGVLREILIK